MPQGIANVYFGVSNTNYATPVTVTFGNVTVGNGTITVSDTAISGTNTAFNSQLAANYVIRNSANVYIGRIAKIINDTSAVLNKSSAVIVNNENWAFQSHTQQSIVYDSTLGNGFITTFTTNTTVLGSSTNFNTQLSVGQILYTISGALIGELKSITSNNTATLSLIPTSAVDNIKYRFYTTTKSNILPKNNQFINESLLSWSKSGLIQDATQVRSVHAPIQDPITGVYVNFPATMHTSANIPNVTINAIQHIDAINDYIIQSNAKVQSFDDDNSIFGTGINKAINSIPINKIVSDLRDTSATTFDGNINATTLSYYGNLNAVVVPGIILNTVPNGFIRVNSLK